MNGVQKGALAATRTARAGLFMTLGAQGGDGTLGHLGGGGRVRCENMAAKRPKTTRRGEGVTGRRGDEDGHLGADRIFF